LKIVFVLYVAITSFAIQFAAAVGAVERDPLGIQRRTSVSTWLPESVRAVIRITPTPAANDSNNEAA
jgi:hypothetical protein